MKYHGRKQFYPPEAVLGKHEEGFHNINCNISAGGLTIQYICPSAGIGGVIDS